MGDISSEPSMEEILSSIKRIIAEEGDAAIATRARRGGRATTVADKPAAIDEVLELSQPVDEDRLETPTPMSMGSPTPPEAAPKAAAEVPADPILSDRAAEATRGPLEALSRMVVKPEVTGTDTLEGMVREMLKPMLRDWLDANLPRLVEEMVAREISRITGRQ
ncbi:DUF2497 domain-containing protein [Sphingomonas sp. CBMAI 2297]|uniref:DUF2497 domain-containing protein n=1 Tax=Sphingomonas sp. CBMAI 2297 TaxID=2991720 RepID=UPI00245748CD|nr:DUF2497 domain-containing protein [Sphingomonas sp. CBMAI 2297]MDH4745076.1 DUF2497 domain-containing protein [Sphingomonas sp. CBMAI 2297]